MTLKNATLLFAAAWAAHTADHVRRGFSAVDDGVVVGGTFVAMLFAVLATLVFVGHGAAPLLAAASGPAIAFGVAASHYLPEWGTLSDPLAEADADLWTWVAVTAEVGTAVLLVWRIRISAAKAARTTKRLRFSTK